VYQQLKPFVCPDTDTKDGRQREDAFAQASRGIKVPPKKKQAQVRIPRGGSKGRVRVR
jgi:hypothetical protein